MDSLLSSRRKFLTSRGYHYSYVFVPGSPDRPVLLFIHGWPSHIDDWIFQIRHFAARGYGIMVPDMLGYGDSSAPSETRAYRLRFLAQDLAELLDQEQVQRVVGIGHDWGVTILSRFAMYHSERVLALALLGIGASKPGTDFNLDAINEMTRKTTGSAMLGYIAYISRDATSQGVMEQNAGSVMSVLFAAKPDCWDRHLRPLGALKSFLERGGRGAIGAWYPQELQEKHLSIFGRPGGYLGACQYYKMLDQNLSVPDEEHLGDFTIAQPVLLAVPKDPAASSQMQFQMLSAWATDMDMVQFDSGHWVHIERSEETNASIERFLIKHTGTQHTV